MMFGPAQASSPKWCDCTRLADTLGETEAMGGSAVCYRAGSDVGWLVVAAGRVVVDRPRVLAKPRWKTRQ